MKNTRKYIYFVVFELFFLFLNRNKHFILLNFMYLKFFKQCMHRTGIMTYSSTTTRWFYSEQFFGNSSYRTVPVF